VFPTNELGYQFVNLEQARSTSPYLFLPIRQESSSLLVDGIKLASNHIDAGDTSKEESAIPIEVKVLEGWEEMEVQETLRQLNTNSGWAVFEWTSEVTELCRSSTPTLENPNCMTQMETQEYKKIHLVQAGEDDIDFGVHAHENRFALVSYMDYMILCEFSNSNELDFENGTSEVLVHAEPTTFITEWDISQMFPHKSILATNSTQVSEILKKLEPYMTNVSSEHSHGFIDEYFAYNADEESKNFHSSRSFLKKDILDTIFDDLWTEVYPKFEPLLQRAINSNVNSISFYKRRRITSRTGKSGCSLC
jgi:hypothetical protein